MSQYYSIFRLHFVYRNVINRSYNSSVFSTVTLLNNRTCVILLIVDCSLCEIRILFSWERLLYKVVVNVQEIKKLLNALSLLPQIWRVCQLQAWNKVQNVLLCKENCYALIYAYRQTYSPKFITLAQFACQAILLVQAWHHYWERVFTCVMYWVAGVLCKVGLSHTRSLVS